MIELVGEDSETVVTIFSMPKKVVECLNMLSRDMNKIKKQNKISRNEKHNI